MRASAPPQFKQMCQNFGPNLSEFVSSWDDLVQHALIGINQSDARAIGPFVEELLEDQYSDEDLKEFWWTLPVTSAFHDGKDVREFLRRLREALSRPPYAA